MPMDTSFNVSIDRDLKNFLAHSPKAISFRVAAQAVEGTAVQAKLLRRHDLRLLAYVYLPANCLARALTASDKLRWGLTGRLELRFRVIRNASVLVGIADQFVESRTDSTGRSRMLLS